MGAREAYHATCKCGAVEFEIDPAGADRATRFYCYCRACRAADVHLRGDESGLTADKAVEIFHTTPNHLHILKGRDKLASFKLNPKGPIRWYARCCGTPLWNTTDKPSIPFMGVIIAPENHFPNVPELGEPKLALTKYARPRSGAPTRDKGMPMIFLSVFRRMPVAWFQRGQDPLVKDGQYFIAPVAIDPDTRKRAYELGEAGAS